MATDTNLYENDWLVKDALGKYFSKYHFENGGYADRYFRIKLGRLFIPVPNTKARIAAVKIHDIHHLVTGYTAFWRGEVEIGAWEIAAGCGRHYVAWMLNLGSFIVGMFLFPSALYHAFLRGRRAKSSLYYNISYDLLLTKTIGELRDYVGVDATNKNKRADYLAFIAWCGCCLAVLTCITVFFVEIVLRLIHRI